MTGPIKPATDDLIERIPQAIERITSGHAPMRIPADMRDADIVLSECLARIESDAVTINAHESYIVTLMQEKTVHLVAIETAAAKIKVLELERDTVQQYADQVGANLTAAEGTLAERDEQIARYEDLLIDIKLALSNTKTFYLPLAEAVADIIRRKK